MSRCLSLQFVDQIQPRHLVTDGEPYFFVTRDPQSVYNRPKFGHFRCILTMLHDATYKKRFEARYSDF